MTPSFSSACTSSAISFIFAASSSSVTVIQRLCGSVMALPAAFDGSDSHSEIFCRQA